MEFETLNGLKRSNMCAEIDASFADKEVVLMGWVQKNRRLGGMNFVTLRDRTGIIQLAFNDKTERSVFEKSELLKSEYVIAVKGTVLKRTPENINKDMKTGEVEVFVTELRILNSSETPPFYIEEGIDTNDQLRLKYRYLDLRRPDMQKNLILRHKIIKVARDYFDDNGFLEIETPQLTKSTLSAAYKLRKPTDLLFHSDQGSNSTSRTFITYLKEIRY